MTTVPATSTNPAPPAEAAAQHAVNAAAPARAGGADIPASHLPRRVPGGAPAVANTERRGTPSPAQSDESAANKRKAGAPHEHSRSTGQSDAPAAGLHIKAYATARAPLDGQGNLLTPGASGNDLRLLQHAMAAQQPDLVPDSQEDTLEPEVEASHSQSAHERYDERNSQLGSEHSADLPPATQIQGRDRGHDVSHARGGHHYQNRQAEVNGEVYEDEYGAAPTQDFFEGEEGARDYEDGVDEMPTGEIAYDEEAEQEAYDGHRHARYSGAPSPYGPFPNAQQGRAASTHQMARAEYDARREHAAEAYQQYQADYQQMQYAQHAHQQQHAAGQRGPPAHRPVATNKALGCFIQPRPANGHPASGPPPHSKTPAHAPADRKPLHGAAGAQDAYVAAEQVGGRSRLIKRAGSKRSAMEMEEDQEMRSEDEVEREMKFDPTAQIIKFDANKELIFEWDRMIQEIPGMMRKYYDQIIKSSLETVCFINALTVNIIKDGQEDLERGVLAIQDEEEKQQVARQTIIDFSNEMSRVAHVLSDFGRTANSLTIAAVAQAGRTLESVERQVKLGEQDDGQGQGETKYGHVSAYGRGHGQRRGQQQ